MKQMFGTNNHYIQDDGCGHEIFICALRPVNSGENTGRDRFQRSLVILQLIKAEAQEPRNKNRKTIV